jgi:hypothetical protein
MSSQPFQQLKAHKYSVKDKLQGVLATIAKVPALIHADTSKEVSCMASHFCKKHACGCMQVI